VKELSLLRQIKERVRTAHQQVHQWPTLLGEHERRIMSMETVKVLLKPLMTRLNRKKATKAKLRTIVEREKGEMILFLTTKCTLIEDQQEFDVVLRMEETVELVKAQIKL